MLRRFRLDQTEARGASLAEFALVLPILLVLFIGIMDLGRLMFLYSEVSNAAREAARWGSVAGGDVDDPLFTPRYFRCNEIRENAQATFAVPQEVRITIQYDDGQNVFARDCEHLTTTDREDIMDLDQGDPNDPHYRIRVTTTAQFEFLTPVVRPFAERWDVSFTSARTVFPRGTRTSSTNR